MILAAAAGRQSSRRPSHMNAAHIDWWRRRFERRESNGADDRQEWPRQKESAV